MFKNVLSVSSVKKSNKTHYSNWIEVDLAQFKCNLKTIRKKIGSALYCLPVKANAYGHGICEIGKAAQEACVDYLAVSSLSEGIQLRKSGIHLPILVLGAFQEEHILEFIDHDLEFSISSLFKAELVHRLLEPLGKKASIHLEIETGMNRTGARAPTARMIYAYMEKSPYFEVKGIYSHLANSDVQNAPSNQKQQQFFLDAIQSYPKNLIFHLANSGALLHFPKSYHQMVRPGLLSFGLYTKPLEEAFKNLKSCFSLKSRVSYFKVVQKDQGISYGHTHKTSKATRIATIPIGYGDGYRRSLSNTGEVLIRGQRFPIIGTICMDQLMVDIGDNEAYVGDEVVLIGAQGNQVITLHELAEKMETIPYEVLTGFNERVPRFYY